MKYDSGKLKERFVKKAKAKFGDKFDYSKVEYISNKHPISIVCTKHGVFSKTPDGHIRSKTGCCPGCIKDAGLFGYVDRDKREKKCNKCSEIRPFESFNTYMVRSGRKAGKVRFESQCKECKSEADLKRRLKPGYKEKHRQKMREFRKTETYAAWEKEYKPKLRKKTMQERLLEERKTPIKYIKCIECGLIEVARKRVKRNRRCKTCYSRYNSRQTYYEWYKQQCIERGPNKCKHCHKKYFPFESDQANHVFCSSKCSELGKRQTLKRHKKKRQRWKKTTGDVYNELHIFKRDKWRCKLCGTKVQKKRIHDDNAAEIDHIIPRAKGGPDASWNVQTLCRKCNQEKSDTIKGQLTLFMIQVIDNQQDTGCFHSSAHAAK